MTTAYSMMRKLGTTNDSVARLVVDNRINAASGNTTYAERSVSIFD